MAKLTRANVCYDLQVSPHRVEVEYNEDSKIVFVFSSEFYATNFKDRMNEHREKINKSLTNRFNINIENNILADIKLYDLIEKRGFLIIHNEEVITCLRFITLDGTSLIVRN